MFCFFFFFSLSLSFLFCSPFISSLHLSPASRNSLPSAACPFPFGCAVRQDSRGVHFGPQLRALRMGTAPRAPPEAQLLPACVFTGLCHQRGLRKLFLWNGCLWTCWSRMGLTQNGDDRMLAPFHPHTGEVKPNKFVRTDVCLPSGVPGKGILTHRGERGQNGNGQLK